MIPTAYKAELSSLLSYPLGALNLSEAFAGVPQFEALTVTFYAGEKNPHRVESPFLVLRVGYTYRVPGRSASNDMIEEGWYDAKWEIRVGAVLRSLRHEVKAALRGEGLERVRTWLLDHGDVTGRRGHTWIHVWYDADREMLTYETERRLR